LTACPPFLHPVFLEDFAGGVLVDAIAGCQAARGCLLHFRASLTTLRSRRGTIFAGLPIFNAPTLDASFSRRVRILPTLDTVGYKKSCNQNGFTNSTPNYDQRYETTIGAYPDIFYAKWVTCLCLHSNHATFIAGALIAFVSPTFRQHLLFTNTPLTLMLYSPIVVQAYHDAGLSNKAIADRLGCHISSVGRILTRREKDAPKVGALKIGRPPKIEPHLERRVVRDGRKCRRQPLAALATSNGIHENTGRKILKKNGMQKRRAVKKPYLNDTHNLIFQQDNAPIHKSKKTADFLRSVNVSSMPWPPSSPDLNPIGNIWVRMKREFYRRWVLAKSISRTKLSRELLKQLLQDSWEAIESEYFGLLVASMPRRVADVIKAGGGHIKNLKFTPGCNTFCTPLYVTTKPISNCVVAETGIVIGLHNGR